MPALREAAAKREQAMDEAILFAGEASDFGPLSQLGQY